MSQDKVARASHAMAPEDGERRSLAEVYQALHL
jgi:hypothetical protein